MWHEIRRTRERHGARLDTALLGLLIAGIGLADDGKPQASTDSGSAKTNLPQALAMTSPVSKPLNLLLTQSELRAFVRNYEIKSGEFLTAPIDDDEVIVVAPAWQAPMRDLSQDVWGGIAAPFWAIMHPKDAWRISCRSRPGAGRKKQSLQHPTLARLLIVEPDPVDRKQGPQQDVGAIRDVGAAT